MSKKKVLPPTKSIIDGADNSNKSYNSKSYVNHSPHSGKKSQKQPIQSKRSQ
jgi:hypothetical protein